jgi:CheY-like chemotaxis protein
VLNNSELTTPTILLVEPSADLRSIYSDFSRRLGTVVVTARTGPEGIESFDAHRPALSLVNLLLPGRSGLDVCRQIKDRAGDDCAVIVMSAVYSNMEELRVDLDASGADGCLYTPFGIGALRGIFETYLPTEDLAAIDPLSRFNANTVGQDIGGHLSTLLLPAEGALDTTPFAAILFRSLAQKLNATLTIEREGVTRSVVFRDGVPIEATSTSSEEGLEALLVHRGIISLGTLNEVILHEEYDGALAEALVAAGHADRDTVEVAQRDTAEQVLMRCFSLRGCTFRIAPRTSAASAGAPINTVSIIRRGCAKASSHNEIASVLGEMVQEYVLPTPWFVPWRDDLVRDETEGAFLDAINGDRTLSEVMALRILDVNHTLEILWAAYQARMVIFSRSRPGEYTPGLLAKAASLGVHLGLAPPTPAESRSMWQKLFSPSNT